MLTASVALEHTMKKPINTFLQRSYMSSSHNINHRFLDQYSASSLQKKVSLFVSRA